MKKFVLGAVIGMMLATAGGAAADDIMVTKAPPPPSIPTDFNWTGFYGGGHLGYAWGSSNWTAPPDLSGSLNLFQPFNAFNEAGSFSAGLQAGYNYMLTNRLVLGAEVDASFPAFPSLAGISIGGTSMFSSPSAGPETYSETVLSYGTVRGPHRLCTRKLALLCHRRVRLDLRSTDADATGRRHGRHALPVAIGLGGRSRRRGPDIAALDRAARISIH